MAENFNPQVQIAELYGNGVLKVMSSSTNPGDTHTSTPSPALRG
ncbi:MAG: hypothetical protein U5L09_23220 [Bacteroidales bacterium]|nr:hypothetical protein [Bacteroidales bacterium]